jgi:pyruvate kinase
VRPFLVAFDQRPRETISAAVAILREQREIPEGTPLVILSDIMHENHAVDSILLEHA